MAQAKKKGGKKNRKFSRNKISCAAYRAAGRREKNKVRKLENHLRRCPNDGQARAALERHWRVAQRVRARP